MTVVWLFVWLLKGTPEPHQWNAWLVSLIVCLAIDCLGGGCGEVTAPTRFSLHKANAVCYNGDVRDAVSGPGTEERTEPCCA